MMLFRCDEGDEAAGRIDGAFASGAGEGSDIKNLTNVPPICTPTEMRKY